MHTATLPGRAETRPGPPEYCAVDWGAATKAGLAAGAVSFLLYLFYVPAAVDAGNAWVMLRYLASVLLGTSVLAPPPTFHLGATLVAVAIHFSLALVMTSIIAFVLHRWGLLVGIAGGAALGLLFFAVNFYTLTLAFPHLFALAHWSVALVHAIFGAVAGGVYELLELEPYERPGFTAEVH